MSDMEVKILFKNARAASLEIRDGGLFDTRTPWKIFLNGQEVCETRRTVTMLYDLTPETSYEVKAVPVMNGTQGETQDARNRAQVGASEAGTDETPDELTCSFTTDYEFITVNVRDFGAKGDGKHDDTKFIQAAIMACPKHSRVLVPAGEYRITSLFLKDDVNLELQKGAVLSAFTDRELFPVLRSVIKGNRENEELILGTWEGDAMDMFAGILTGLGVKHACVYGPGTINGNASRENWWNDPKKIRIAARPRMIFLNRCEDIVFAGITVKNSPSWNIHPYFSNHLKFIGLNIEGPKDSPNTDGLDPESCQDVEIVGVHFSVGDDCIAVKSGKISVGAKYKTPSQDILIRQCCMRDGHGSITLGSEMAAGIKNLKAIECKFINTDRGLRIKTRRGRGKDAVIDGILFENIYMDEVLTPFVINSFYFCDADGKSEYVQDKKALPIDERTPYVKRLAFRKIKAFNCHVAAAFFYGLPERKIEEIDMEDIKVTYAKHAKSGKPAMMCGIPDEICKMGIYANNVKTLILRNVDVQGQDGEPIVTENVDTIKR